MAGNRPEFPGLLRRPQNSGSAPASRAWAGPAAPREDGASAGGRASQEVRRLPPAGARPSPRRACRHSRSSAAFLENLTLSPLRLGCDRSRSTSTGASHGKGPNRWRRKPPLPGRGREGVSHVIDIAELPIHRHLRPIR